MTQRDDMKISVEDMQARVSREMALPSRLGYTALLVAGLGMSGLNAALWLTEPALPARTRLAFVVGASIGAAWAVFAAWVLSCRRVLLARHRVIAARMAVAFTGLFAVGALAWRDRTGLAVVAVAAVMFAAACVGLLVAHRRAARLLERRRALEGRM